VKEIPLTQGKVALVDDADYPHLSQFRWHASRGRRGVFYAKRNLRRADGRNTTRFMHAEVVKIPLGLICDHANQNGLDNRRANLRLVTASESAANTRKRVCSTRPASQYKGVARRPDCDRWQASIMKNGRRWYLGIYRTEDDAARVYDAVAEGLFFACAKLNFS
jgi:hypothetical protein